MIEHIKANLPTIQVWIDTDAELQPDNDILKPIVTEYVKEFQFVNLMGCRECLIDMLRWAVILVRKDEQGIPVSKKKK